MPEFRPLRSPITIGNTNINSYSQGYTTASIFLGSQLILQLDREGFTNDSKSSFFEYAEILRNYLDVEFDGTYTSQTQLFSITFTQYDQQGGSTLYNQNEAFYGVSGYSLYTEGANVIYNTNNQPALSTTTLYIPDGVAGYIPTFNTGTGAFDYNAFTTTDTTKTIGSTTFKINRICEPKYQNYKVTFVNKFGALQDIYFYLVRRDTTTTRAETYKANITTPTGGYTIEKHAKATFDLKANDKFTLNTTFLDETYNDVLSELMLSEKVWITENSQVLPIRITSRTLDRKTSLNDKLIQYTLEFEYAFDRINNIL